MVVVISIIIGGLAITETIGDVAQNIMDNRNNYQILIVAHRVPPKTRRYLRSAPQRATNGMNTPRLSTTIFSGNLRRSLPKSKLGMLTLLGGRYLQNIMMTQQFRQPSMLDASNQSFSLRLIKKHSLYPFATRNTGDVYEMTQYSKIIGV